MCLPRLSLTCSPISTFTTIQSILPLKSFESHPPLSHFPLPFTWLSFVNFFFFFCLGYSDNLQLASQTQHWFLSIYLSFSWCDLPGNPSLITLTPASAHPSSCRVWKMNCIAKPTESLYHGLLPASPPLISDTLHPTAITPLPRNDSQCPQNMIFPFLHRFKINKSACGLQQHLLRFKLCLDHLGATEAWESGYMLLKLQFLL